MIYKSTYSSFARLVSGSLGLLAGWHQFLERIISFFYSISPLLFSLEIIIDEKIYIVINLLLNIKQFKNYIISGVN